MRRISDTDQGRIIRAQIADPPKGEGKLHCFARHFWSTIERRPFVDGPHLHAKCEALEAVSAGEIKKLIINEPPNSGKSVFCNIIWPAFIWAEIDPGFNYAFASYDIGLVNRDAKRFQELICSPRFRAAYPGLTIDTSQAIQDFKNSERGSRFGTTPGRAFTGRHFGGHVYDDLVKPADILTNVAGDQQAALKEAIHWFRFTASNRAEDAENLWRVVIAQRLHESDPSGQLLKEGDWEHLCLPERYVKNATWIIGDLSKRLDKRTEPGELLWPQRRGPKAVAEAERNLHTVAAVSAQLQQNPTPTSGGIIHRDRIHRYQLRPKLSDCQIVASLDLSFKGDSVELSRCAGLHLAKHERRIYLIDAWADHLAYGPAKAKVRELQKDELWSQCQTWVVEDKANGPALQSDLEGELNIIAYQPGNADKVARMLPFVEFVHSPEFLVPEERNAPWVEEVIAEICNVPRGTYDDYWDCLTQGLAYLITGYTSFKDVRKNWDQIRAALQSS